jgi:predicted nuclease with TOPRIM domain
MEAKLKQRLTELRAEYESGQKILKDIELKIVELEDRKKNLKETILRISGAIDLLEEMLEGKEDAKEPELGTGNRITTEIVDVPNVIKQPLKKAIKILEDAGFTAGEIVEQKTVLPIGVMAGDIIRQEPKQGTSSQVGSAIKLVVAVKGKFLPPDKNSLCDSFSDNI